MITATCIRPAGTWSGAPDDVLVLETGSSGRRRLVNRCSGGTAFFFDLRAAGPVSAGDAVELEDGRLVELRFAEPVHHHHHHDGDACGCGHDHHHDHHHEAAGQAHEHAHHGDGCCRDGAEHHGSGAGHHHAHGSSCGCGHHHDHPGGEKAG